MNWNPGAKGKRELWGYVRPFKKINFRYQKGVYVLFTQTREVVYVGQVGAGERAGLYGRLRAHTMNRRRERWTHFSWFGVCAANFETKALCDYKSQGSQNATSVLDELEGILIHLLEPRLNRQGPKWKGISEYLQLPLTEKIDESDPENDIDE